MSQPQLIIDNLKACWASCNELYGSLEGDQWQVPSHCPDWTVHGVLAHQVSVEQALSGWLPESAETPPPFGEVAGYVSTAMAMSGPELAGLAAEVWAARAAQLEALDPEVFDRASITPVGPGTYGRFMAIREFDHWMHERDCRTPLSMPTDNGGPAAEMALDEVHLSIGYIVGKKVGLADGDSMRFDITGAVERDISVLVDGRAREVDDVEHPTVTLHCDSMAFMDLACGRIDPEAPIAAGLVRWSGDAEIGAHAARNLRFTM
ncbi:maleylpyruvate isomerase family mycothiol-dependent enzyme [Candidatus Poriferisodalis sp.]|uniref:maleylpyruvate isomerase family mycothiol-dependent enzyme n=1 Tax=Candidatus Poriferisodalis sp. TaxID=3101277 RepID=UPI003B029E5C